MAFIFHTSCVFVTPHVSLPQVMCVGHTSRSLPYLTGLCYTSRVSDTPKKVLCPFSCVYVTPNGPFSHLLGLCHTSCVSASLNKSVPHLMGLCHACCVYATPHVSLSHLMCLCHTPWVSNTPHVSQSYLMCLCHTSCVSVTPRGSLPRFTGLNHA